MTEDTGEPLEHSLVLRTIVTRAANEGVPVGAIGRIIQYPFDVVSAHLKQMCGFGVVGSMPKADWPPSQHWDARMPTVPRTANPDDIEFGCRQHFKLTPLEAAILLVLLRYQSADKDKLHGVVESQRAARQFRPDSQECTDPKMVDVMICKLRAKLKRTDPALTIMTVWGKGYFIEPAVKDTIYRMIGVPHAFTAADQRADDLGDAAQQRDADLA